MPVIHHVTYPISVHTAPLTKYLEAMHREDLPRKLSLYGQVFVSHGSRKTIPETIDVIHM